MMDKLQIALLEKAAHDCLAGVMRGRQGRNCYVLIVCADGPYAAKTFAHSPMTNGVAMQFADAIEHEADQVRTKAEEGSMATVERAVAASQAKIARDS